MQDVAPKVNSRSPWGKIQHVETIIPHEMWFVSTAGHGGVKCNRQRNAAIPVYMRQPNGWYEEDCEYAIPFVIHEKDILSANPDDRTIKDGLHFKSLRTWYPDEYEQFTGITIQPGESYIKDERQFNKDNENNWIVISACKADNGMTECIATLGSKRHPNEPTIEVLIPSDEYKNRGQFGYVLNAEQVNSAQKL
jgi:hypothetical protein